MTPTKKPRGKSATLAGFPASYITALYTKPEDERKLIELMRQFPSVTVIDLEASLAQVRDVMDKASLAVQAVLLFTLVAGLAVLWAAVQSSMQERSFESAILRTLGASRGRVLAGVLIGFFLHARMDGWSGLAFGAEGIAVGFAVLLPFHVMRMLGAGDVKLMAMVGVFLGPWVVLGALLATFLARTRSAWRRGRAFAT